MNTQIDKARIKLRAAIVKESNKLIKKNANVKLLADAINRFSNDCYLKDSVRTFNEHGDYVSQLTIPNYLEGIDEDLHADIIGTLNEDACVYVLPNKHDITLETNLMSPTTINFTDTRRTYAIHSDELSLKVDYSTLIGDDDGEKLLHALYIIECAMRKCGVFGDIVEVDYYGGVMKELSTDLGHLDDKELATYGERFKDKDE